MSPSLPPLKIGRNIAPKAIGGYSGTSPDAIHQPQYTIEYLLPAIDRYLWERFDRAVPLVVAIATIAFMTKTPGNRDNKINPLVVARRYR